MTPSQLKRQVYQKKYDKKRDQLYDRRKYKRIQNWKRIGVVSENYDELYNLFYNTHSCEDCDITLKTEGKLENNTRVLDHDHETGEYRGVVCLDCNFKRGWLDNLIL
tara:strand:+ start:983 stop:1303 length:321 start_codon:yes stop_codon:yes gene_type:complete